MNDLESKIFDRFDDDTVVHPGHGDTTLGSERPHLAEWRRRCCSHGHPATSLQSQPHRPLKRH